jgi:thiamine biosynthesis lipoprotein
MFRRCRPLLGTFVEISAGDPDAIDAAFPAIERVHRLMSAHEPESDVSRINRFAHIRPVEVHDWTAVVIERALTWSGRSRGAFDVVSAGKAALGKGLLPSHPDQPPPVAAHWTWLEVQGRSVRLLKPGCIDLGGIAKGFAVDRAVDALREVGCVQGLVNAGGDIRAFGAGAWPVDIVHPLSRHAIAAIDLRESALATSAGLPDRNGELTFDHLPANGEKWLSVSVLAPTACDADALTKIVWTLGHSAAALLKNASAKALALTRDGAVVEAGEPAAVAA